MPVQHEVISLYHQYLARLIKDHHFDIDSTKVITLADFPDELVVEKAILKIIHQANSLGATLSQQDIALQLATSYGVVTHFTHLP